MMDLWWNGQRSSGETAQQLLRWSSYCIIPLPDSGLFRIDSSRGLVFFLLLLVIVMKADRVFLSDALVQCDSVASPPSCVLPSQLGTSAESSQLPVRTEPRDGGRASASGVSLRRGDAGVQVGEPAPLPQSCVSLFYFPRCFFFFFSIDLQYL